MSPGHAFGLYQGQVIAVRRGKGQMGGDAPQTLCTVRLTTGAELDNVRVIGPYTPLVNTTERPSWCIVGFIAANIDDPVLWPLITAERRPSVVAENVLQLETLRAALTISSDGQLAVRGRSDRAHDDAEAEGDADWRLRIGALGSVFEMLGGEHRMARGADGAGAGGDKLAINAATSPQFATWVAAVTAAVNSIPAIIAAIQAIVATFPAVQLQMAAVQAWSVAATPGALVIPPGPAAPAAPAVPGALPAVSPQDPVPAYGDQGLQPAVGFQVAGELRTGSNVIRGK